MQNTAYELRISDWSSDLCSSDLSATAFFTECFIDELAAASGLDPLSFRIRMLRSKPRPADALKTAAGIGGFAPFAGAVAQGLAVHETAGAVVAVLAAISHTKDQGIAVDRILCAVDVGRVDDGSTTSRVTAG